MFYITDQELLNYNLQGIIPGPSETEQNFILRAKYCQNIEKYLCKSLNKEIPFSKEEKSSLSFFKGAQKKCKNLFNFSPNWLPIFFSNRKLSPWHGGCAWIFQLTEDSPTSAFLQLRKKLHKKERLLGCYDRDELITHELAHIGRMAFEEPKFEEILAYSTSSSPFRRYLGPIFQSSVESFIFVMILLGIIALDAYLIFYYPESYEKAMWLKLIPLSIIALGSIRLIKKLRAYQNCLKHIKNLLNNPNFTKAVLYRLSDQEILNPSLINEEIKQPKSLRWRLIKKAYFD